MISKRSKHSKTQFKKYDFILVKQLFKNNHHTSIFFKLCFENNFIPNFFLNASFFIWNHFNLNKTYSIKLSTKSGSPLEMPCPCNYIGKFDSNQLNEIMRAPRGCQNGVTIRAIKKGEPSLWYNMTLR